jgi:hypothetical protein
VLITLSGFADSLGFVYAAKIWQNGVLSWPDVGRSALGWVVGITLYVISLKYMARLGVTSAEIQTTVWFAMTIIGVVIFSGRFSAGRASSKSSRRSCCSASAGCSFEPVSECRSGLQPDKQRVRPASRATTGSAARYGRTHTVPSRSRMTEVGKPMNGPNASLNSSCPAPIKHGIVHLHRARVRFDEPHFLVDRDPEHDEAAILVVAIQGHERRNLALARHAPRRPEVHQHHLALY